MNKIPEAELEIMMIIWDADKSINADYIMERLHKSWVKTTLLNFLTRLVKRGFLSCEKSGRINIYTPLIKKEDYLKEESKSFLSRLHSGSVTSLVASLYDGGGITKEDLTELERFIREAK